MRADSDALMQQPWHASSAQRPTPLRQTGAPCKFPFLAVLLPVIALGTFGQIKTLDRLTAHFPKLAEMRLPAYEIAVPVEQRLLPPLSGAGAVRSSRTLFVRRGDTLQELLAAGGVSWAQAEKVVAAIREFYDPRKLRVGQELNVTLQPGAPASPKPNEKPNAKPNWEISDLVLQADAGRTIVARRQADGGYAGEELKAALTTAPQLAKGEIDSSLFVSAQRTGLPVNVIVELIRLFSFDVDFQRDIQPGDRFEVLYDHALNQAGEVVSTGAVRYAALTLSGDRKELFRHVTSDDGVADYFNRSGHGAKKALMKTPVDGARLSSNFGLRKHPILGYTRMHKGVDFAAPKGTPIMAAGDGVVELAGWNGAYGKYIRIRHNSNYQTAYAHVSGFGKTIHRGARVRQGQIIGFTGSTGRSTGPHLHYEILAGGKQVNPQSMKLPTARKLTGRMLADFKQLRDGFDKERQALSKGLATASLR